MCTRAYYTITRARTVFTRYGYNVRLWYHDGTPAPFHLRFADTRQLRLDEAPMLFCGNDWREVKSDAIAFAKAQIAAHYAWHPHTYEMA